MAAIRPRAFTLVEILIVVVILGILAAIIVPQMVGAQTESQISATLYDLGKIRRHVVAYEARNDAFPEVQAGDGTWGQIVGTSGDYLMSAPINAYVGGGNRGVIILRDSADTAFQTDHGWIFDAAVGEVWAGGFSAQDAPLPK
ncbi:MAG: prepilin-type N-terminal cleavage/methylation domain-containing protein [Planctomycetota bacterium]